MDRLSASSARSLEPWIASTLEELLGFHMDTVVRDTLDGLMAGLTYTAFKSKLVSFLEKDTDKFLNQLFEKRNGLLKSGGAALDDTQSNKRRAGETAAPQSDQKRVKTDTPATPATPAAATLPNLSQLQALKEEALRKLAARTSAIASAAAPPPATTPAPANAPAELAPPSSDIALALARAKEAAARARAQLSSSLAALPASSAAAAVAAAAAPAAPSQPKRLAAIDAEGRMLDEDGNIIALPMRESTLKVNQRHAAALAAQQQQQQQVQAQLQKQLPAGRALELVEPPSVTESPFFDPSIAGSKTAARGRRSLHFHDPGTFVRQAEAERAKERLLELQRKIEAKARQTGLEEIVDIGDNAIDPLAGPTPDIEWWDSFLVDSYDDAASSVRSELITALVQHPVPLKAPDADKPVPVREMYLTDRERKKMRRQKKLEAEKERQMKVQLGLMPPPPPKVKLSNMMRVLGDEAIQDPTRVEALVRAQVAQRLQDHTTANQERKLTREQRHAKELAKMQADRDAEMHVAVFRVGRLDHPQQKFRVDRNASQLLLTGCAVLLAAGAEVPASSASGAMVVVEGGQKSIRKYKKLMLRRIKWNDLEAPHDKGGDDDEADEAEADGGKDAKEEETLQVGSASAAGENRCVLVWEGVVRKASFRNFRIRDFVGETLIRDYLRRVGVEHYWDHTKNYVEKIM